MRIAIDCRWLNIGPKITHRGTGRYVLQQIEAVLSVDTENTYLLIVENVADFNLLPRVILDAPNVRLVQISTFTGQWNPRDRLKYQEQFAIEVERLNPDVYHQPAPMGRPALGFRQFDVCPYVVNLFDLIPLHFPDNYPVDDNYKRSLRFIKHADQLITLSEYSKEDIATRLDYDASRIHIAYPYADKPFRKLANGTLKPRLKRLLEADLPEQFFLTVAGYHHSKNIDSLIQAHGQLPDDIKWTTPLVLACHLTAWEAESVERYAALADANVFMTGYVTDDELVALYNKAVAYIHPSRLEGFGLPPLEAMRCKTQVVLADASSLPEVGGDVASYFDPEDIDSITNALQLATVTEPTDDRLNAGLHHAAKFNKRQLGLSTLRAYGEALRPKEQRPTIAMWGPIPPVASGIADYTRDLCAELVKTYDIELFIDDDKLPDETSDNYLVHHHSAYFRREAGIEATVHQFGNSVYHEYQYRLMPSHHNAIVVLHDLTWSFSLFKQYAERDMYGAFGDTVTRLCGPQAGQEYRTALEQHQRGNSEPLKHFMRAHYLLNVVIYSTDAQIVHVDVIEDLENRYPDADLYLIPQSIAPIDLSTMDVRDDLGLPQDAFIVGTFGHVSRAKRVDVVIEAFKQLLKIRSDSILLVVGPHNDEKYTQELIEQIRGIEDKVMITNLLPDAEFKATMAACDVAVQMRHPSQGQSSRAITQAIATGKPVIMSDIPEWEYPALFAHKVAVGELEVAEIAKKLSDYATDPVKVHMAGTIAKEWHNANNNIEAMAARYVEVIEDVRTSHELLTSGLHRLTLFGYRDNNA